MFAGNAPPHLDAPVQDLGTQLHRLPDLFLIAAIVEDEGMEIAIARMEDVGHREAVLSREVLNLFENNRKLGPRDDRVLQVAVRADLAHGSQGCLPPLPKELAFFIVLGDSDLPEPVRLKYLHDEISQHIYLCLGPVQLHQKDRPRIHGVTGFDPFLHRLDTQVVHHLEAGWDDPSGDNAGDGVARVLDTVKDAHQGLDRLWLM